MQELLELTTASIRDAVGDSEMERTLALAAKITRLQPSRLRKCTTTCPMRDVCTWITTQSQENHPDVLGIRCPVESQLWADSFNKYVGYVYSMDPEGNPPSEFEMAMCKDIAWLLVEEHRVMIDSAGSPDPIIESVVPGTDGMTAETLNPRMLALNTVRKDTSKALDRLIKLVHNRLENVKDQKELYIKSIQVLQAEMKENPERYKDTRLGGLVTTLSSRINKNQEARAQAENEKIGGGE
jgi:hypothetical protein